MFRACLFAVSAALLLASAGEAAAGRPLLTLAYTANSLGEFQACPSCGKEAEGGLGRRATFFRDLLAAGQDRTLILAGPYEFTPIVQRKPGSAGLALALARAYGMLGYDLGVATPQERQWLAAAGASMPAAWRRLGNGPSTVTFTRAGLKVAVVLLPEIAAGDAPAASAVMQAVQDEAKRARKGADLVVGVSPWGEAAERVFLDSAPGACDVLLGGGRALGYGVRLAAGGRTIWVRPPFDGRGVVRLDILALPREANRHWREGEHVASAVRMLDPSIMSNAEVNDVFASYMEKDGIVGGMGR